CTQLHRRRHPGQGAQVRLPDRQQRYAAGEVMMEIRTRNPQNKIDEQERIVGDCTKIIRDAIIEKLYSKKKRIITDDAKARAAAERHLKRPVIKKAVEDYLRNPEASTMVESPTMMVEFWNTDPDEFPIGILPLNLAKQSILLDHEKPVAQFLE